MVYIVYTQTHTAILEKSYGHIHTTTHVPIPFSKGCHVHCIIASVAMELSNQRSVLSHARESTWYKFIYAEPLRQL